MNADRDGVDALRDTIEEVATDIEAREPRTVSRRRALAGALAAMLALIAILAGYRWMNPPRDPEVEVLVLKIHGRPVKARLVEGAAPATIIVVPRSHTAPAAVTATAAIHLGGTK
jgi:hypothetical protein